jgi:uncharacterized protein YjbI with pentapeptide repeats
VPPDKTPRERAEDLIRLLVPDWRLTSEQVMWTVRIVIAFVVLQALFVLIGAWLWEVLVNYVQPSTPSDRKDLINVFVLIGAGVVGFLTATAAVGNLYISRRNLQQQRILEEERAQDDALQAYYKQMGDLLTEHDLKKTKPEDDVALLARAQTLTAVRRLDASRKGDLVRFLYGAGLISGDSAIVKLRGSDLRGAFLSRADLRGAFFSDANLGSADLSSALVGGAFLRGAGLRGAFLRGADLREADLLSAFLDGADLRGANLRGADLRGASLIDANLGSADLRLADLFRATGKTSEELTQQAASLDFATMPNGQKYEDWLKSKDREANGKNDGSS